MTRQEIRAGIETCYRAIPYGSEIAAKEEFNSCIRYKSCELAQHEDSTGRLFWWYLRFVDSAYSDNYIRREAAVYIDTLEDVPRAELMQVCPEAFDEEV